jgi:hypothetical protein
VNFETIEDLILNGRSNSTAMVRTDKKTKRKRGDGACVSIVTEPVDKTNRVSFFKRRRIKENTAVSFGNKYPGCGARVSFRLGR